MHKSEGEFVILVSNVGGVAENRGNVTQTNLKQASLLTGRDKEFKDAGIPTTKIGRLSKT